MNQKEDLLGVVREVIRLEGEALLFLHDHIGEPFYQALKLLAETPGRVVLTGVGKSGIIAKKIAATLTSTGTSATFLHPSDGMHGDLGVVAENDVVIALGKSGESEELIALLPVIRRIGAKIIAITARNDSRMAKNADVALITPVEKEACPLNLAPTVSTTLALAVGDALAVALMKMKNFRTEDFARYHPGGKLGKRLFLKVTDVQVPIGRCAVLDADRAKMTDVLMSLTEFGHGIVLFLSNGSLRGILTDGDIRQLLQNHATKFFDLSVSDVMNTKPLSIPAEFMAVEALKFMEDRKRPLNVVPILDDGKVLGIVRLHDLLAVS